ncbi:MAG: hypothetical protein H0W88_02850 [Parachlamydiaceae bacterium]|nr:hypothetical protein [Parachlamydiaceae bacterium]
MKFYKALIVLLALHSSILWASEFTISSYNCGGLTDHYDYLRAAAMQKIMLQRYIAEPKEMALNEKIQKVALKILFSNDSIEKLSATQEWDQKGYQRIIKNLTRAPIKLRSPNTIWFQKTNNMISSYQTRPVTINDEEVNLMLQNHINDLTNNTKPDIKDALKKTREIMAKRIFHHQLKYDIICLQEADYLDASMFPSHFEVLLSTNKHSVNGLAWNKERFEIIEVIGSIMNRAFAIQLLDNETRKKVLVASGHISGCNPYNVIQTNSGKTDSEKGDKELKAIVDLFTKYESDLMVIGMDANVTSLHPRLRILKDSGFMLDYENYLEQTCTNPYQVLNTRIDWIAVKPKEQCDVSITNIPVSNVGLNCLQTNISDHKPVAAKIKY